MHAFFMYVCVRVCIVVYVCVCGLYFVYVSVCASITPTIFILCVDSQSYTASAWRVNLEMPLVILLHIRSVSKYLDGVGG